MTGELKALVIREKHSRDGTRRLYYTLCLEHSGEEVAGVDERVWAEKLAESFNQRRGASESIGQIDNDERERAQAEDRPVSYGYTVGPEYVIINGSIYERSKLSELPPLKEIGGSVLRLERGELVK